MLSRSSTLSVAGLVLMSACAGPQRPVEKAQAEVSVPVERIQVPLLAYELTPAAISTQSDDAEKRCDTALQGLVNLPQEQRTFANTIEAMVLSLTQYIDAVLRLSVLKDVHPNGEVRHAAADVAEKSSKYLVRVAARRDLYQAVKDWQARADQTGESAKLAPIQKRLLELTLRDFRRNGLELDDTKLARLVAIRSRLAEVETQFQLNLGENKDQIVVTQAELAGMPEAWVSARQKAPGKTDAYIVTTKYPDYVPFMENAKSGDARKRLYIKFQSREAEQNTPLLKEAIALRDEEAKLLGFANHADYVADDRMAKNSGRIATFLADIQKRLVVKRDADFAKMTAFKRAETKDPKAKVEPWDVGYYLERIMQRDYALDSEKIREYFPVDTVLKGMFTVYEKLLSITIAEVPGAKVWAPEVKLYSIKDRTTGQYLASFYLDLYPRDGKYGHAAVTNIAIARQEGNTYRAPLAMMMANFNPPSGGRPSLFAHDEVRTLFHEFGHIMHECMTTARYGSQSGTSVARDFVEAPSQMLENWVFEKPVLDLMSGHYLDPTKKLPAEMIAQIRAARVYDAGYRYTRQVFLATYDQKLHTSGPVVDPDAVDAAYYKSILGMTPVPGTHFSATFGHIMGGYDAGYYGYLWSEVYSDDMFTAFEEKGVLDEGVGRRYRDTILAKGRSEEADQLLREFLGREPNNHAFLKKIGIDG